MTCECADKIRDQKGNQNEKRTTNGIAKDTGSAAGANAERAAAYADQKTGQQQLEPQQAEKQKLRQLEQLQLEKELERNRKWRQEEPQQLEQQQAEKRKLRQPEQLKLEKELEQDRKWRQEEQQKLERQNETGWILRHALEEPLRQLAENAGHDGAVVVQDVRRIQKEKNNLNNGFEVMLEEYGDMLEKGIIDPAKVVRSALENAASIAAMILTTEALITDMPEKGSAAPMPQMPQYYAVASTSISQTNLCRGLQTSAKDSVSNHIACDQALSGVSFALLVSGTGGLSN
jgi:TCP-1/cpn60 chaperonin family protein